MALPVGLLSLLLLLLSSTSSNIYTTNKLSSSEVLINIKLYKLEEETVTKAKDMVEPHSSKEVEEKGRNPVIKEEQLWIQ